MQSESPWGFLEGFQLSRDLPDSLHKYSGRSAPRCSADNRRYNALTLNCLFKRNLFRLHIMLASTSYQQLPCARPFERDAAPRSSPSVSAGCNTSILRRQIRRVFSVSLRTQKGQLSERLQQGKLKHRARLRSRLATHMRCLKYNVLHACTHKMSVARTWSGDHGVNTQPSLGLFTD